MMRKKYAIGILAFAVTVLAAWMLLPDTESFEKGPQSYEEEKGSKEARIKDAFEYNLDMIKDLELGHVPKGALAEAINFTRKRQEELANMRLGDPTNPRFRERGPNNRGGRTRVIHIDLNDPSRKTIFAGSVAGGLWKCEDITEDPPFWEPVNDYLDNLAVGGLAQDPNNPDIMYMGTGEGYPNFDAVQGIGIFKSTDGGKNWQLLPGSVDVNATTCQDMLVHPLTSDVYAATTFGLFRSQDEGNTWEKVHGQGFGGSNFFFDIDYVESGGFMIASNTNTVYKSETGNGGEWENLTSGQIEAGTSRIEVTVCEADPDVMYLIGAKGGAATKVYRTNDGGQTWQPRALPSNGGGEFTNGQAWYDLDIGVDPFNCEHTIAGGVPSLRSVTGGFSYDGWSGNMHVDQHTIVFDKEQPGVVYLGNDGGIYRATGGTDMPPADKNLGYNVTQFYAGAIHPEFFSNYILGGTQDNNSLRINKFGITAGENLRGGDGFFAHIDQNEPDIQMVSSQFGNYGLSTDGGGSFGGGVSLNGSFVCPSDYDNDANLMYAQTNDGDLARWNVLTGQVDVLDITGAGTFFVSHVFADPNVDNRIYVGSNGTGRVVRIDDAHDGLDVAGVNISNFTGTISSITVENGDPDHILVTVSNYGSPNSVMETKDGGDTWINVEGNAISNNLPNVPVRWGIFNPANSEQAMIATEVGVWITDKLDGDNTQWYPPIPGEGTPLVRSDMLQVRESDRIVAVFTHGRGIWTSDVWADPVARLSADGAGYEGWESLFSGEQSYNPSYYDWQFSDGGSASTKDVVYEFTDLGTFDVTLAINDTVDEATHTIKILPEAPLPYEPGEDGYLGDFEGSNEQFASQTVAGSGWERGASSVDGKAGTNSGENAWVVNIDMDGYDVNSEAYLYLPKYDFSEPGIYEFSFWAIFDLQLARDGFRVEYRTEDDPTWKVLGPEVADDWYNVKNTEYTDAGFALNDVMFSRFYLEWTQFKRNISELSGLGEIAFRFAFKSDGNNSSSAGVAIDDVVITRFEGEAQTQLTQFIGEFSSGTETTVSWTTIPEFNCQYFELYRSDNGVDYELIETIQAKGVNDSQPNTYEYTSIGQKNLYFFRLKVFNENEDQDYYYEFESDVLVLRRNFEEFGVYQLYPNPFTTEINMSFNDLFTGELKFDLFDAAGRLIYQGSETVESISFYSIPTPQVAAGVYFLRLQLGEEQIETFRLLGGIE
ncbi:MAG: T9SS type A sorting domain-containing protein [Bacteroidetes bacterium]|nr:T9SS type A sorting domain-containing protein [Bacteroidota bacterium]